MPSRPHNAYSLLGVPLNADTEEIEAAYEHRVAENENEPKILQSLKTARDCLVNTASRELYDNRAGVEEPRRRSPNVTYKGDGDADDKAKAVKPGDANWKRKAAEMVPKERPKWTRASEDAILDKVNKMLDWILKKQ